MLTLISCHLRLGHPVESKPPYVSYVIFILTPSTKWMKMIVFLMNRMNCWSLADGQPNPNLLWCIQAAQPMLCPALVRSRLEVSLGWYLLPSGAIQIGTSEIAVCILLCKVFRSGSENRMSWKPPPPILLHPSPNPPILPSPHPEIPPPHLRFHPFITLTLPSTGQYFSYLCWWPFIWIMCQQA